MSVLFFLDSAGDGAGLPFLSNSSSLEADHQPSSYLIGGDREAVQISPVISVEDIDERPHRWLRTPLASARSL